MKDNWNKQHLIEQPQISTEYGKRSFSQFSLNICKSLPLDIRLFRTYDAFKPRPLKS